MKSIKYSNARQTLRTVIDECVNNKQPVIIESRHNQVVIISKDKFDSMVKQLESK